MATKKIEPYSPFYIKLEHVVAPFSVKEGLPFLQRHANQLGVTVECEIHGETYIASPGDSEPFKVQAFVPKTG